MLDLLAGFVTELRAAGIPVSLSEHLDAAEALRHVPLEDREAIKYTLGASLVKSSSHWRAYETTFEIYFSLRGPDYRIEDLDDEEQMTGEQADSPGTAGSAGQLGRAAGGGAEGMTPEELAELLFAALLRANPAAMAAVARQAVTRYAGMESGRPVGGTYYLYRTLRNLDLDGVLDRLLEEARRSAPPSQAASEEGAGSPITLTALEERLLRDEYQSRIDELRREIENEIRRRLVADRGSEALARSVRKPLPEDIDMMHATRDELVALRQALRPLSRKLAVRLARKRRHGRKGPLDFRSTMRHSLSTGGVPVDPKFRYPRPSKPEIVIIADISGSVASFARFTLHLVHAISTQFSKVRSFVFIDGIDEVTSFFEGTDDPAEAVHRINTEADVVWVDGHSDYGHALTVFWERWGEEMTPRTSVLLLGDARNNYHASQSWVVKDLGLRARHVYWLNPEPRAYWNSGDSIVGEYGVHCDEVVECRTLRQLEQFRGRAGVTAVAGNFDGLSGATRPDGPPDGIATVPGGHERDGNTRIVLVRHGEAVCNVSGVCGGELGCSGLTGLGRAQVEALRLRLAASGELAGCDALYASVLARARQTAEILAPVLLGRGAVVRARCDLCELHPGQADGLSWAEFAERFGEPDWDDDPGRPIAPGGESWTGFVRRVAGSLDDLAAAHPGGLVVVACHAGVIEASLLTKLPVVGGADGARLRLATMHASMTSWDVDGDRWRLLSYNDTVTPSLVTVSTTSV